MKSTSRGFAFVSEIAFAGSAGSSSGFRSLHGVTGFAELVEGGDHHQADTAQRDEADGGRNAEGHAADEQREDAAGEGERDAGGDDEGLPEAAERGENGGENEEQRGRDDNGEARARFAEILKVPPKSKV